MTQGKRPEGDRPLPLPEHRSGAALDRKIIDYARAQAPPREAYPGPRWYAGMATAAVVVAAVLITLPPQSPVPTTPATQEARQEPAPAAAAGKMSAVDQRELRAGGAMASRAVTGLADEADADTSADAELEVFATRAGTDAAAAPAGTAPAPGERPDHESLAQQIDRFRAMLHAGAQDRARAGYRRLRLDCQACQLPETLEEALLLYPAPD